MLTDETGLPYRRLQWSAVGLFRFSALTFNGHKIHYDGDWTRIMECHPGPVVHGPLNLINMLDYWRDVCGGQGTVGKIRYKALLPLYAGDTYQISVQRRLAGLDDGNSLAIQFHRSNILCMEGTVFTT